MRWILIRHGATKGNLEGRYIGCRTDESLCPEGLEALRRNDYPPVRKIYSSPMIRCLETASVIYPGIPIEIIPGLRECDFGLFENKNYAELNGRADYQAWIDSGGELPFPGGENRAEFAARCRAAFEDLLKNEPDGDCALIVHGGTIMAIMEAWAHPSAEYYDFQVKNGHGYILEENGNYFSLP